MKKKGERVSSIRIYRFLRVQSPANANVITALLIYHEVIMIILALFSNRRRG